MASDVKLNVANPQINIPTRFLSKENFKNFFAFDKDTIVSDVEINTIDKPVLLDYYIQGWQYYR